MTAYRFGPRPRRAAAPLRFLLLCLGGWVVVRAVANWNPVIPMGISATPAAPWVDAAPGRGLRLAIAPAFAANPPRPRAVPPTAVGWAATRGRMPRPVAAPAAAQLGFADGVAGWSGDGRHRLRLALMARLLPPLPPLSEGRAHAALPVAATLWSPVPAVAATAPGGTPAFWMRQDLSGWSLGTWLLWRDQSARTRGGIAVGTQLGGSQAGARLAFGFGDSGRVRTYGRATIALTQPQQRELALGVAFAPVRHWPLDVAVEQRIAIGREGRSALAAMLTGGVGDMPMPHGFRLEAYAQAGVVGAWRRDAFADAAMVIDREIAQSPEAALHVGALAAGSVQPGAARVDIGPRLTLRLPKVGGGSRVALDWRQRVVGAARPKGGLALTLGADF